MAIYGAGSSWDNVEQSDSFFSTNTYQIGWSRDEGHDLHVLLSFLKCGDILYLKSNKPGSRNIHVKGIGMVYHTVFDKMMNKTLNVDSLEANNQKLFGDMKWIVKHPFEIVIPESIGKLTNIRSASFYEECLPYVQRIILNQIIDSKQ